MVHSAIEHSNMHFITDMYNIFSNILRLAPECVGRLWPLEPKVLAGKDWAVPLVDLVFDRTGEKDTGKWVAQDSVDLMAAAPTFSEVVHVHVISDARDERIAVSKLIPKQNFPAATPPSPSTTSKTHSTQRRSPAPLTASRSSRGRVAGSGTASMPQRVRGSREADAWTF
jgi:6-phosphogluconate dehydrogenase